MNHNVGTRQLMMPWASSSDTYSAPGRLVMKLALGEAPEAIPTSMDVRRGRAPWAERIDGGPVDRILRRLGGAVQVARAYSAAHSIHRPGVEHDGFDDLEHALGLSRTFRVRTQQNCCIEHVVDALRQLDVIEQAGPHYLCATPFQDQPHSPGPQDRLSEPWSRSVWERAWQPRQQIHAAEAMAYEAGDPTVVVAIVDTGVAVAHPELYHRRQRIRSGWDSVELNAHDLAVGVELLGDLSGADLDPTDEVGHGTSCAAIVGAAGDRIPAGLAGDCSLLPVRVLGAARLAGKPDPIGIGAIPDINVGLKRAIDLGAKVINMSFGTVVSALNNDDPLPHEDVVRYGLARGCIMIAASGNSGDWKSYTPASLEGVITVGSVGPNDRPSPFTTMGEHIDLCAPGQRVLSAELDGYRWVTGTSFAAPFVAAAAALLVSRGLRRSHPVDAATVRDILIRTARPWAAPRVGYGAGVLDACAALRRLDEQIDGGEATTEGNAAQPVYAPAFV